MSNKIRVIRASDSDSDAEIVENPVKSKKVQLVDDSVDVQFPQKYEEKKPKIQKVNSAESVTKKKIKLDDSEETVVKKTATKKKVQLDDEEKVVKHKIQSNDEENVMKKSQLDDSDEKVVKNKMQSNGEEKIIKKKIQLDDSDEKVIKKKIQLDDSDEKVTKKPAVKKKIQLDDSDEKITKKPAVKNKIQLDDEKSVKKKPVAKKVPKIPQTPQQIADEVKSRIIEYLTDRDEFVPTLEIAKYIYGEKASRQMVNKELYALLKKGIVEKQAEENGTKPHWKIA